MKNKYGNNIKLIDFIRLYNFRDTNNGDGSGSDTFKNDTKIIRIEDSEYGNNTWFEFGLYDFGRTTNTLNIAKHFIKEEILEKYVGCINYQYEYGRIVIYLTDDESECYEDY